MSTIIRYSLIKRFKKVLNEKNCDLLQMLQFGKKFNHTHSLQYMKDVMAVVLLNIEK